MRLETTITDRPDMERIEYLQQVLDVSNASLLREAVLVYAWAVSEKLAGRRIASVGSSGPVREFTSPFLERASWLSRERIQLSPEGLMRVAQMVQEPPEPTRELRELMSDAGEEEAPAG